MAIRYRASRSHSLDTPHSVRLLWASDQPDAGASNSGARGGAVVEALLYKPEGRGIDSRLEFFMDIFTVASF
jgi:hypothetical protein